MNTRHKILNLIEDEDYFDEKDDADYNINNDSDLNSDFDEDYENLMGKFGNKTTNRKTIRKNKRINAKPKQKPNIILRKSFKNSLGRKTKNTSNYNNKENFNYTNNNDVKNFFKKYNENSKRRVATIKNRTIKQKIPPVEIQLDKTYFYQNLTPNEWKEISNFISSSLTNKNLQQEQIENFFSQYPNLSKGEDNIIKLRQILNDATQNKGSFFNFFNFFSSNNIDLNSYKKISEFIINNYYMAKPSIFEVHFFPNKNEENHLINLISKTSSSIDIAMYTLNSIRIAEEIKNIFKRGIKIRIITDSKQINNPTSKIYYLAAMGISIKTDDHKGYLVHHKFCVIDYSVVVTGSFNWTNQAAYCNKENLLFLENKDLARQYSNEFQRLWDEFDTEITQASAIDIIREKEKNLIEKENNFHMRSNSYDKNNNISQKRRNVFFGQENFQNNKYYMYQPNNPKPNEKNIKEKRNSSCLIF